MGDHTGGPVEGASTAENNLHQTERKEAISFQTGQQILNRSSAHEWKRQETSFHGKDVTKPYGPSTAELSPWAVARGEVDLCVPPASSELCAPRCSTDVHSH